MNSPGDGKQRPDSDSDTRRLQARFIRILIRSGALQFGQFRTKSGRDTPYFLNFGALSSGPQLAAVSGCYAAFIEVQWPGRATNLYGPAYKGIPLAVATAIRLATHHRRDVSFTCNRKEAKGHGEGGVLLGRIYERQSAATKPVSIVIVEDVLTGGTSLRESALLLRDFNVHILGAVVGVNRCEVGTTNRAASDDIEAEFGFPVRPLVTIYDILASLTDRAIDGRVFLTEEQAQRITLHLSVHGAEPRN